ncbi:hypothetical protein U1Q18_014398, partial [Sarracenia purpurea var. burkii]
MGDPLGRTKTVRVLPKANNIVACEGSGCYNALGQTVRRASTLAKCSGALRAHSNQPQKTGSTNGLRRRRYNDTWALSERHASTCSWQFLAKEKKPSAQRAL